MVEDVIVYESSLKWNSEKMGTVSFPEGDKPQIAVATPPEFGGHEGIITPEDLFLSAANSMKTEVTIEPTAISARE